MTAAAASCSEGPGAPGCFHCGLAVPEGERWVLTVFGAQRSFCCPGCREVCRTIISAGLEDYYRQRTANAPSRKPAAPSDVLTPLELYDHEGIQKRFVKDGGQWREASLLLDKVRCPACLWLNDRTLRSLSGVLRLETDYSAQRMRVRWDPTQIQLSEILQAVARLGYAACPYDATHRERLLENSRRRDASRLIFAAAVTMPIMQFSLATYFMGHSVTGVLELWEIIGRWFTLAAVTPVLGYSGQDFFLGAWRDLRNRRLGMDVPIVLGLSTAYLGSLVATITQHGHVYVDSIAMFVLLVLIARVYEARARITAANALDRLARIVPATARRLLGDGLTEELAAVDLKPGNHVLVGVGEIACADGLIVEGCSSFDESPLTGEQAPVPKRHGDRVLAGACNREQPVVIEVTHVGQDSTPSEIGRLLERGLSTRPRLALLADRAAQWLVAAVLLVAGGTAGFWLWLDPSAAIANVVSVLIVTCPCAFALATPVASALGAGGLADAGVLPLRLNALEALATADIVAFDKTGTLTLGELEVVAVQPAGTLDRDALIAYAKALEEGSHHPVARALRKLASVRQVRASARAIEPGAGVSGTVNGTRWRLGKRDYVLQDSLPSEAVTQLLAQHGDCGESMLLLGDGNRVQGAFLLKDRARPGQQEVLPALLRNGVQEVAILSGDSAQNVECLARRMGVAEAQGGMSPEEKLQWMRRRQMAGQQVMMVGDGVNDAPTLAGADVSISFADATELAQLSSDFVILARDLGTIAQARKIARRTRLVISQNLLWAAAYNVVAVPLAAVGWVPPWAAAIGMAASSLLVVANALRLRPQRQRQAVGTPLSFPSPATSA